MSSQSDTGTPPFWVVPNGAQHPSPFTLPLPVPETRHRLPSVFAMQPLDSSDVRDIVGDDRSENGAAKNSHSWSRERQGTFLAFNWVCDWIFLNIAIMIDHHMFAYNVFIKV